MPEQEAILKESVHTTLSRKFERAVMNSNVSFRRNDLGLYVDRFTPLHFKRIAALAGDDEQVRGKFFLRQYQVNALWPVIYSVLNKQHKTFYEQWPRQSGKSSGVGTLGAELAAVIPTLFYKTYPDLSNGVRVGIYGPRRDKAQKLRDKIETVLSSEFYKDVLGIRFETKNSNIIKLSNGSSIISATASDQAKCVEQPSLHLIITEETQALSRTRVVKSLAPMLSSTAGTMVHIGTASNEPKEHGFFYDIMKKYDEELRVHHRKIPGVFKLTLNEVFNTPGTETYRKTVLSDIKKYGIDSPEIQSQYFGVWDFDVGKNWIREDWLTKCRSDEYKFLTMTNAYYFEAVIGIDVAKVNDSTVVTILERPKTWSEIDSTGQKHTYYRPPRIRHWLEIHGDNYPRQAKIIRRYLSHFKNLLAGKVDTRGPGHALFDMLVEKDPDEKIPLQTYPFLERDEPSEMEISQEWNQLKMMILARQIQYPQTNCPERVEFEREMIELIKKKMADGRVRIDHPATEFGKKDFCDSLRLAIKALQTIDELDIEGAEDGTGRADNGSFYVERDEQ